MHKIATLENKWFHYKVKKLLTPLLVGLSLMSIIFGVSYYLYTTQADEFSSLLFSEKATNVLGVSMEANDSLKVDEQVRLQKERNTTSTQSIEKEKEVFVKMPETVPSVLSFAPIIPVIDIEKEERIADVVKPKRKKVHRRKSIPAKKNSYLTAAELGVIAKAEKSVVSVPHKTKKINFKTSSLNYIETMKAKFEKSNNSREALLISKAYYKEGNYKNAEKWALSANKLNSSLEESWLMFAKSKAKLGKKEEAIKILASYYKRSNSGEARDLIGQIKRGKI